ELKLKLQPSTKVPIDTRTAVKPRSILGAKYLALELGHSKKNVPAGGVLAGKGSTAPVELSDAFNVFGDKTRQGLQNVIIDLRDLTPVLADAADLARAIRPATALLPSASRRFATALTGTLGPLRHEPTALADVFAATLRGIDGLAAFRPFVKQDLGSLFLTTT